MSEKRCLIMRGASGAGKDWWIINSPSVPEDAEVHSADDFFMSSGRYVFDRDKLPEAHNACLREFVDSIGMDRRTVVVNNTNTKLWEIAPYYRLAEAYGYDVEIVWVIADPIVCAQRNQHGTPADVIMSMITGVDQLPPWWRVRVVLDSLPEPRG